MIFSEALLKLDKNVNNFQEYDFIVITPINLNCGFLDGSKAIKVGICLAYEINELSKINNQKEIILSNLKNLEYLIVDSFYLEKLIRQNYHFKKHVITARYGCDIRYEETKVVINPAEISLIVTRNWTQLHNNNLVLEAVEKLDKLGYSIKASFIRWPNMPENFFEELNLDNSKYEILNYAENHKISEYLNKSWLYVSAALSDGSSVSLLEAMNNGNIVLVSDFKTNLEIVKDGINGFIFENNNLESLVQTIRKISNIDLHLLQQISENAKNTVKNIGNWKVESKKIIRAFGVQI